MKVVALVPARSGSKGLPGKNIKNFLGKPLVGYAIDAALNCGQIDAVYLNSDSEEYLGIGERLGARPYLRDPKLAVDDTPIQPVILDFVESLAQQGEDFDALILLYPIYPLRFASDLSSIITEFNQRGGTGSMLGAKVPSTHPYLCMRAEQTGKIIDFLAGDLNTYYRRQSYPTYHELSHWAYITSISEIPSLNNQLVNELTTAYFIPEKTPVVDIDTPLDFAFGEFLMAKIQSGNPIPGQI